MTKTRQTVEDEDFRIAPRVIAGLVVAVMLVGGVGGWAATARLSGAIIAQGAVAVDQNLKSVQHRDGGIVSELAVREGDLVRAGQVLIRLDDAQTKAELSIIRSQITELRIRRARLESERDGRDQVDFPADANLTGQARDLIAGELRLFEGHRQRRQTQQDQLRLGLSQIDEEITGLQAQRRALDAELRLVRAEHDRITSLAARNLVEDARVYAISREQTQLDGRRGEVDAAIARARARIGEIDLQILAVDENARTEAQRELTAVEARLSEIRDREAALGDRLARTDIRAPITGTVNELNIHTIGGVITPAEVLVTIVPQDARLRVEAKIAPTGIDQVMIGQEARMRFTALNQRTTPEILGRVDQVSPATTRDDQSGEAVYIASIEIPADEAARLGQVTLLPGMPVEVYFTTESRTALSYLVKPVTDQLSRAMRER